MTNPNPTDPTNPAEGVQPAENAYGTAYPTAGYPGTGYGAAPMGELQRNKLAPWALGIGVVSILICWLPLINFVVPIVGVVLAILALRSAGKISGPFQRKGMSIGALILSVIGLICAIVVVWLIGTVFGQLTEGCEGLEGEALNQCVQSNADSIVEQSSN